MGPFTSLATLWVLFCFHAVSGAFLSQIEPCPDCCGDKDPKNWTVYSSLAPLSQCNQPILFDFSIHTSVNAETIFKLRACNAGNTMPSSVAHVVSNSQSNVTARSISSRSTPNNASTSPSGTATDVSFQLLSGGTSTATAASDYKTILYAMQNRLQNQTTSGTAATILFGYSNGVTVGMFVGAGIHSTANPQVFKYLLAQQPESEMVVQLCGNNRTGKYVYGLSVNKNGDISAIQKNVLSWQNATCVERTSYTTRQTFNVAFVDQNSGKTNSSSSKARRDGTCQTIDVAGGDSCTSLASECGISGDDFEKYNSQRTNLCSTLAVGEKVCCSSGGLPNWQPSANPDGTCVVYNVQSGDNCQAIALNYGWQLSDLSDFNDGTTWGWTGCDNLPAGIAMCVSKGTPPLPASVSNAECGPTVPGTTQPDNGTAIADLNPCPLNSCCDIWGQCGITELYCNPEKGPTGNPGTAPKGEYGCVSNCGTNVTNNGSPPSKFISIGYYEQFNWDRECLNMRVSDLQNSSYTHIHWAFAGLNDDFSVNVTDDGNQFSAFLNLTGVNRIVSFGGWGYSTDPSTYATLLSAMKDANRALFVNNLVEFVSKNNLDGIDIDWEYPGEPDIPGIPPGQASDGPNYLRFLLQLKAALGTGKTLSIAAPASYWYLTQFPIKQMSQVVDYIVYMTYDLHGQWDYGNKYSQDGCPDGNCLRSHVNLTETNYALAMITKAGVNANKVAVGISAYGRAFGMTDPSCTGPDCTFQGATVNGAGGDSTAEVGRCTSTAGYISNAEIEELIENGVAKGWYDDPSNSDLATWNSTWVAYESISTRTSRTSYYQSLNFGGITDWAVDLLAFTGDDGDETDPSTDDTGDDLYPSPDLSCSDSYTTLDDIEAASSKIPYMCAAIYMVQALQKIYNNAMAQYYKLIANGYDDKFNIYAGVVVDNAGDSVTQMIYQNGTKYFKCIVAEVSFCCSICDSEATGACTYCRNDTSNCTKSCDHFGICTPTKRDVLGLELYTRGGTTPIIGYSQESEPCPPDYSKHGYGPTDLDGVPENSIWWSFQDDNATAQFYADLYSQTAIPKNKTSIQTHVRNTNDCAPSANLGDGDDCWNTGVDYTIPNVNNYTKSDVINPKDVVTAATSNATDLLGQIADSLVSIQGDLYEGDFMDIVDSISIPIMMINSSITQMATIEAIADEITKEKRLEIILAFFSAVLFLIPFAGEVLGSIGELAEIGEIVTAVGQAGNVAFDIYSVASDPSNAPLAIMSAIFEPLALLDSVKVAKAAATRRGMSDADVAKLGDQVKPILDKINSIKTGSKCAG